MKGMSCHAWPQEAHQSQSEGRGKCSLLCRLTPWTVTRQAPLCPWNSPGKNTGEGSQPFPSQGIFPDPGIRTRLSHCTQILYHLNYKGSLKEERRGGQTQVTVFVMFSVGKARRRKANIRISE